MAKSSAHKTAAQAGESAAPVRRKHILKRKVAVQRDPQTGQVLIRVEATMRAAERSGFLAEKNGRISGRVSPALVRQAKRQTGIETDTDLIAFALASIALEDNFAAAFSESRGTVDPDEKLGF